MGFYEERIFPIIDKTADALLETEHMQHIINGTLPLERFQFQLKQNFNYLREFSRCWAIGLARCSDYDEMSLWYASLKGVFEQELGESLRYWMDAARLGFDEMELTTMGEVKRSYTAHELASAWAGDNSIQVMSQFPCTIIYENFAEKACPLCKLPEGNMYRHWLFFYISDWYKEHCARSVKLVNKLAEHKSPAHLARMEEACAISCNYEILQFTNLYNEQQTWPLPEIIPDRAKTIANWKL